MSLSAEVSWDAPPGADPDGFLVERFDDPSGPWVHVADAPADARRLIVDGLPEWGTVRFRIRCVIDGTPQPEDSGSIVTLSRTAPTFVEPPPVTNFRASQQGWTIACEWDDLEYGASRMVDAIEVREGPSWELGIVRAVVRPTERRAVFGYMNTGAQTYRARARDILGRYSPTDASAAVTPYPDEYYPIQTTIAEAWAGTLDGAEDDGGDLRNAPIPVLLVDWSFALSTATWPLGSRYRPDASYVTPVQDRGAVVTEKVEVKVDASLEGADVPLSAWHWHLRGGLDPDQAAPAVHAVPVGSLVGIDSRPLRGLGVGIDIAHSEATNPPADWVPWIPGSVYRFRYVRLRMRLAVPLGLFAIRVASLEWWLRRRNLKKHGRVEVVDTTGDGTSVTFGGAEAFTVTPNVTATPEVEGAVEVTTGEITTTGCKLKLYDLAGTRITGWVQWHAMGE